MKKNVASKIIIAILIFFSIFSLLSSNVYASSISSIFTQADDFINRGQQGDSVISKEKIQTMSDFIYNTLLIAGIIIAVIVGIIIGIKLMAGSIEEKAKVKETLIVYVIGCVVIFGAFTIWKIVVTVLQSSPSA